MIRTNFNLLFSKSYIKNLKQKVVLMKEMYAYVKYISRLMFSGVIGKVLRECFKIPNHTFLICSWLKGYIIVGQAKCRNKALLYVVMASKKY